MAKRTKKENTSQLEKLLVLPDLTVKQSGKWLTTHLSFAIEHLPDKEELIFKVFKQCVIALLLLKRSQLFRKRILSMLGCRQKSNWMIFLDRLNTSSDLNMLTSLLLRTLVQELTLRERAFKPFWTPAYKEISEKLWLPIETDCADLVLNSSNRWSTSQVEKSRFLTIRRTELVNKNLLMTSCPSSMSSLVDKWAKEVTPPATLRTVKIKINPTPKQKEILNRFIDTSRYVYNKTLEHIKKGHKPNFQTLRDILVTENSKKGYDEYKTLKLEIDAIRQSKKGLTKAQIDEIDQGIKEKYKELRENMKKFKYVKNTSIKDFELYTAKDIRSNAVNQCCDAYKSGFSNLKRGNIKFFNLKFRKKTDVRQTIELTPKNIVMDKGSIKILPETFKEEHVFKISKLNQKRYGNLEIKNNVDIVREKGNYYLHISVETTTSDSSKFETVGGVDPGVRVFATVHTNTCCNSKFTVTEYKHRADIMRKYNKKLDVLKRSRQRIRKKQFAKIETRKSNLVDKLHWDVVNDLLKNNDVIYFGDIKSHNIVKGGKNSRLNRDMNDLKFYRFKQRLQYKASLQQKVVFFVPEPYTTKCCSSCGTVNDNVGCKEVFSCGKCGLITGRDMNASKNIKMKGMFS